MRENVYRRNNSRRISSSIGKIILYIVLICVTIITLFPFIWTISSSFKTLKQFYNGNPIDIIPKPFRLANYTEAWHTVPMGRFIMNSALTTVFVTSVQLIIGSMAAYAFSRLNFKGKNIIFILLLGTMMVPGHVTLIPNYIVMSRLNWINKYQAILIPPIFTSTCVTGMFIMRQYFLSIPKELEDAAIIDGCSRYGVFYKIIIPNSKPALATFGIISFNSQWNAFLWPLIVMTDKNKMPIQVGLSYFKNISQQSGGPLLAGTTIAILPVIIIFLIFQKNIVNGTLTSGLGGK